MRCEHRFQVLKLLLSVSAGNQTVKKLLMFMVELLINQQEGQLGVQLYQLAELSHYLHPECVFFPGGLVFGIYFFCSEQIQLDVDPIEQVGY